MKQLTTTLNRIRKHSPCHEGWVKLLSGLGKTQADDEPLTFSRIAAINGLNAALWCCQCEPKYRKTWRLFAVWCARQVEHLMTDQRSKDALNVAERHASGLATNEELYAAMDAARAAVWDEARAAANAAAKAVAWDAARNAAWDAARNAAWDAAWAVAWDAARAVARDAAWDAAMAVARDAAWDAAKDAQLAKFIEMVDKGE